MKNVTLSRPLREYDRWKPRLERLILWGALGFGLCAPAGAAEPGAKGGSAARARPEIVRLWSSRYHPVCPLPRHTGGEPRPSTLSVDSPTEWANTLPGTEVQAIAGKEVRWSRERVILYAPAAGNHLTELSGPPHGLWLSHGSLYWPVHERPASVTPPRKGDRSCLVGVVSRAYWVRIKVIDPALIRRP